MNKNILKFAIFLLAFGIIINSCNKDDDDDGPTFVENDRTEQQLEDKAELQLYLETHYYNSSFFSTGTNHKYTDIIITELPKDADGNFMEMPDPDNNTLLIDAVETFPTEFLDTEYEYHILTINQGGGNKPNFTDAIRFRYEGSNVETEDVFESIVIPTTLSLQADQSSFGAIRGFQLILPKFKSASSFNVSADGTVNYDNFGLGVMFIPSGLAYFSGSSGGGAYSNLIFKFELLQFEEVDHDNDGIPSYVEDINNNQSVIDDDTDEDNNFDFIDFDDDGDGVATINELISKTYTVNTNNNEDEPILANNEYERSRSSSGGIITINTVIAADANDDTIPDYLDKDITTNYNEDSDS